MAQQTTTSVNFVAVGLRVQALLDQRGMNHSEFARRLNVARQTVIAILNGDRASGRIETLARIAFLLDVSIDFLLYGHQAPSSRAKTPKPIEVSLSRCRDLLEEEWVSEPHMAQDNPQEFAKIVEMLWNLRFNRASAQVPTTDTKN